MVNQVECESISRKFEDLRLKNGPDEKGLLESIQKEGILQPLGCVLEEGGVVVLLDGFKRFRSALKLRIPTVPITCLGVDEVHAVCELLYQSNEKTLNILEQAAFCDHLHLHHKIGVIAIADRLKKSPAWVSVRLGMLNDMSPEIKQALFQGRFPVRSYMYTLRPFTRVNKIAKRDLNEFVRCVEGKALSTRDIERLAVGFFKGGENLKTQIQSGNISWTLKQLKSSRVLTDSEEFSDVEMKFLRDLEVLRQCIEGLILSTADPRLKDTAFFEKARSVIGGIFEQIALLETLFGRTA
ncbi:MAG: ParB N-terminal domain-containing protein [Bacteroidota bacterium]